MLPKTRSTRGAICSQVVHCHLTLSRSSVDATQAPKEVTPVGSLLETKKLDAVTLWQLTREKVEASLAQRVKKENAAMALADLSSSQASSLDDSTIAATESTLTSSSANSLLPADEPLAGAPTSSSQSSADAARAENLPNLPSKDAVTSVDSHSTVTAGLSISTATFPATCPQKTIQLLLRIEATMCALAYDVDLCKNTWAPRHTLLVDYILRLMQKPSIPERVFLLSARARTACATFTKTHLGGPFGKFINHVLRRYRNETALFLSRWPSTLMPIVHSAYLRPMVYEYLRTLMQTYDLEPFDSDIVAAARQLRAARH